MLWTWTRPAALPVRIPVVWPNCFVLEETKCVVNRKTELLLLTKTTNAYEREGTLQFQT